MCPRSCLQSGSGGDRNAAPPRVYRTDSSQDSSMDETEDDSSSPGEAEGFSRASDRLLFKRLCGDREHYYRRVAELRRRIIVDKPELTESLSSLIRLSIKLGRLEQIVLCCDPNEDAPLEGLDRDEDDD